MKSLFLYVIFFVYSINNIQTCKKEVQTTNDSIEYLKIFSSLNLDTIHFNDTLLLTLDFKNKSDTTLYLYPESQIFIILDRIKAFDGEGLFWINMIYDVRYMIKLLPDEGFRKDYKLCIKDNFFHRGLNKFVVVFRSNLKRKENNSLFFDGRVVSNECSLFVIE